MSATLKMIHVARKELGLDEERYRDLLYGVTEGATTSLRAMSPEQHQAVIERMKGLGFEPRSSNGKLSGPYARKLVALWLSGWNLGVIDNRHEHALIAFVNRQTGLAHPNWLRDQRDASKAVDGLKLWIGREAGVEWPAEAEAPARAWKIAVIAAQHRRLGLGERYVDNRAIAPAELDAIIAALGKKIREAKA